MLREQSSPAFLLRERIFLLEEERAVQAIVLKAQFKDTLEELKPLNMLKQMFASAVENSVVDTAIGMGSGYLAKKTIVGSSKNPFLKIIGSVVGMGVANLVAKHPDGVKSVGGKLLDFLFRKAEPETASSDE